MSLRRIRIGFLLGLLLLLALTVLACYCFFKGLYSYLILIIPAIAVLALRLATVRMRVFRELEDFHEAVMYRDFTRSFPAGSGDGEIKLLRKTFNGINQVFHEVSSEREIQYQYLQNLLEIADTSIISYNLDTGKVAWMNESFRKLFAIPFLNNFEALQKRSPDLYRKSTQLSPGTTTLFTVESPRGPLKLQLYARDFQTMEGRFRMISCQNVNETIDRTESLAWQKLLSVLTHEIMNSIAPISSLASTLSGRISQMPPTPQMEDIRVGVDTIRKRSEGLLRFAQTYRSLNQVSNLNLRKTTLSTLFENINQLFEPTLIQKGIELDIIMKDPSLQYEMDGGLIEQVLINLVLNAIEAVKEKEAPYISITAQLMEGDRLQIRVTDNGKGIAADLMDSIFVPFFTTRKTGSGVGLTLGKQIMLLHGGNIRVESKENTGSTFTLAF